MAHSSSWDMAENMAEGMVEDMAEDRGSMACNAPPDNSILAFGMKASASDTEVAASANTAYIEANAEGPMVERTAALDTGNAVVAAAVRIGNAAAARTVGVARTADNNRARTPHTSYIDRAVDPVDKENGVLSGSRSEAGRRDR